MLCLAEVHSYLVVDTFSRIGRKVDVLFIVKGFGGTDKSDYSDRNQIIGFLAVGVVLLDNKRYQTEIVVYQLVTGGKVALCRFFKAFSFFLCGKLSWKRTVILKMQSKENKALQCGLQYRYKHNITLRKDNDTVYSGHSACYAGTAVLT